MPTYLIRHRIYGEMTFCANSYNEVYGGVSLIVVVMVVIVDGQHLSRMKEEWQLSHHLYIRMGLSVWRDGYHCAIAQQGVGGRRPSRLGRHPIRPLHDSKELLQASLHRRSASGSLPLSVLAVHVDRTKCDPKVLDHEVSLTRRSGCGEEAKRSRRGARGGERVSSGRVRHDDDERMERRRRKRDTPREEHGHTLGRYGASLLEV